MPIMPPKHNSMLDPMKTKVQASTPRFDLLTLQLVLAVKATGSVARAAETMHLTASAVSKRILELEDQLGTAILERHSQGARLNQAGLALSRRAESALTELHSLQHDMADFTNGTSGSVRLASNTSGLACGLADQLVSFNRQFPGIKISVREATSTAVVQAVADGLADIGIASAQTELGALSARPYRSTPLVVAVPVNHPLAEQDAIHYAQTLAYPHIGRAADSALGSLPGAQAPAIQEEISLDSLVTSFSAVFSFVRAAAGVAVVPFSPAQLITAPDITLVALKDAWAKFDLCLVCDPGAILSPAAGRLLSLLGKSTEDRGQNNQPTTTPAS